MSNFENLIIGIFIIITTALFTFFNYEKLTWESYIWLPIAILYGFISISEYFSNRKINQERELLLNSIGKTQKITFTSVKKDGQ